uniref:Uncharacterized protein n=1 Tax=viral metagenome TaxID=1070528 RepID=A0A6C0M102_9ZZZZ
MDFGSVIKIAEFIKVEFDDTLLNDGEVEIGITTGICLWYVTLNSKMSVG